MRLTKEPPTETPQQRKRREMLASGQWKEGDRGELIRLRDVGLPSKERLSYLEGLDRPLTESESREYAAASFDPSSNMNVLFSLAAGAGFDPVGEAAMGLLKTSGKNIARVTPEKAKAIISTAISNRGGQASAIDAAKQRLSDFINSEEYVGRVRAAKKNIPPEDNYYVGAHTPEEVVENLSRNLDQADYRFVNQDELDEVTGRGSGRTVALARRRDFGPSEVLFGPSTTDQSTPIHEFAHAMTSGSYSGRQADQTADVLFSVPTPVMTDEGVKRLGGDQELINYFNSSDEVRSRAFEVIDFANQSGLSTDELVDIAVDLSNQPFSGLSASEKNVLSSLPPSLNFFAKDFNPSEIKGYLNKVFSLLPVAGAAGVASQSEMSYGGKVKVVKRK